MLLLLFLVPLFFTLSTAFLTEEGFSLSRIQQTFTSAYTIRILLFTLYQATLSTIASVVVALPGAYLLANGSVSIFAYLVFLVVTARVYNPIMDTMNNLAALNIFSEPELWRVGFDNPLKLIGRDPKTVAAKLPHTMVYKNGQFATVR